MGVASLDATWEFPLLSFCLGGVPPRHQPLGPGNAAGILPSPVQYPWSTQGPCSHLGQWKRLWGPRQSQPILPQSSPLTPELYARMGRPSRKISAQAGRSAPSCHSWHWGWTRFPALSRWRWTESTRTEGCISCTRYSLTGLTSIWPDGVCLPAWESFLPRSSPRWRRSPTSPSRHGPLFAPYRKWTMSPTLVGSPPIGRRSHARGRGRRRDQSMLTWPSRDWPSSPRTARRGLFTGRRTDPSTFLRRWRVC